MTLNDIQQNYLFIVKLYFFIMHINLKQSNLYFVIEILNNQMKKVISYHKQSTQIVYTHQRHKDTISFKTQQTQQSVIIVKSLQLHGRRQIAKPRKYCLVRVIVFFGMCCLYFFLFLISWEFGLIPYNQYQSHVRFEWEQWQRKQERHLKQKSLMAQTLRIGGSRLKIISMGGNCICSFGDKT